MFRIDYKSYPTSINMITPCAHDHVGEYVQIVCALIPNTLATPFDETM
jgi:hypothetical protein